MKTLGSIVFPNARWMTGRGRRTKTLHRKTIQTAQGVDMLRHFQPPLKILLLKTKCTKPKSIKKGTKMHLPVLWTLNIPGGLSAQLEGVMVMEVMCAQKSGWQWSEENGCTLVYGHLVSSPSLPSLFPPTKLRKVCCFTSSFKTKPALISLYLTTCWKKLARRNWGS